DEAEKFRKVAHGDEPTSSTQDRTKGESPPSRACSAPACGLVNVPEATRNRARSLTVLIGRGRLVLGGLARLGVEQAHAGLLAALDPLLLERGGQPLVTQTDVPLRGVRHDFDRPWRGAQDSRLVSPVKGSVRDLHER